MDVTLEEAAALLGLTVRQVRYRIQQGELSAKKVGGRWCIDKSALPRSDGQQAKQADKLGRVREVVDQALGQPAPSDKRRYSLADLKAFQVGRRIYAHALQSRSADDPAVMLLRRALLLIAQGCHRFHREEKAASYAAARDLVSEAVCELFLGAGDATELIDALEQDLLAAFAGLLRKSKPRTSVLA